MFYWAGEVFLSLHGVCFGFFLSESSPLRILLFETFRDDPDLTPVILVILLKSFVLLSQPSQHFSEYWERGWGRAQRQSVHFVGFLFVSLFGTGS